MQLIFYMGIKEKSPQVAEILPVVQNIGMFRFSGKFGTVSHGAVLLFSPGITLHQVSLTAQASAIFLRYPIQVGGHSIKPSSLIPSLWRHISSTSGFPPCKCLRLLNSRSTQARLIGPADCRNSVYSHSSAFQGLNFFFATLSLFHVLFSCNICKIGIVIFMSRV